VDQVAESAVESRRVTRRQLLRIVVPGAVCAVIAAHYISLLGNGVEHRNETILVDGTTRKYLLAVPRAMGSKPVPLVVAFHGTGDSPQSMASYSGLDHLASEKRFILVYPNAVLGMWKVMGSESADDNRDIRFVDVLLDRLSSQFHLDPQRIYVVGMSNGASFAQLLAAHRSRRIAAVVAHSGTAPRDAPIPERAFSVMLVVGADDMAATVDAMRAAAADYRRNAHPVELSVVERLGHEWAKSQNAQMWEFLSLHPMKD
jgi:polyhydroxybutyrate depolymerase